MSKATKAASAPSVAAKAAKETTGSVVSIGVMVLIAIFVVIPMLPSLGQAAVGATVDAAGDGAERLGKVVTPLPARLSGMERNSTVPTTVPAPKPYGEPHGAIKPLPSQAPPPEPAPDPGRPTLENPIGRGGVLKAIPGVGPALESTARALGTGGLKALNP